MGLGKKQKIVALVAVLCGAAFYIVFTGLTGGFKSTTLPKKIYEKIEELQGEDKKEIEELSKKVVELLGSQDYEGLAAISDETLSKTLLSSKTNEEVNKEKDTIRVILGKKGKAKEYKFGEIAEYKVKANNEKLVLVNLKAKYEKGSTKFTLFFNNDNKLIAFKVN